MNNDLPSTGGAAEPAAPPGRLDARYLAFLETITQLRPNLHRYCARMTGSVWDGEDVVQEALFEAYRKLDKYDESRPLAPWLFRIAHNRCIDFLRRRDVRQKTDATALEPEFVAPVYPPGPAVGRAVEHLVTSLPPKERACILLKDVFDYTLEEISELVDSTVGGVKAALSRGRAKLATAPKPVSSTPVPNPELAGLLRLYAERFNRRDWNGLRELISADARLLVVDRYAGTLQESPYFGIYERMEASLRLAAGEVDGEAVIVIEQSDGGRWSPKATLRLHVSGGKIVGLTDYWFCPWMVAAATSLKVEPIS
jgi:RNA polymerase sigma-70 factor (ECF subfamily)